MKLNIIEALVAPDTDLRAVREAVEKAIAATTQRPGGAPVKVVGTL